LDNDAAIVERSRRLDVENHKICGFNVDFDWEHDWETDGIVFRILDIYVGFFVHKSVEWNNLHSDRQQVKVEIVIDVFAFFERNRVRTFKDIGSHQEFDFDEG
jgi:hypothetical protein